MEQLTPCPVLADLLAERQPEIRADWIGLLRGLAETQFQQSSQGDLAAWTDAALVAMIECLRTGSERPLIDYAARASRRRDRTGPAINEAVEGLLLMRDAAAENVAEVLPQRGQGPNHPSRYFDAALRVLIARLAMRFAEAMHESLREERDRTAYLLDATGAAGESLELSVVMPTVALSIKNALGHSHCSIYLWDETRERFSLCATSGRLQNRRLGELMQEPIDPLANTFAAEALTAREITAYRSVSGCRFGGVPCHDLEISTAVVLPIRLGERLLAFALVLDTQPGAVLDSHELVLASAIARSVAPAVDNARRHTQTMSLLQESQKLQKSVETLLEMQGLEDLVEIVCREVEPLLGAVGSAIFLGEDGAVPEISFKQNPERLPGEGVRLGDCEKDPRCMVLPLQVRGHRLGRLVLAAGESGFSEEQRRLASGFADQVAVAIQHAMLHRQHEQLAALNERQRLARDLHDSVNQSIYGVTMYGEAASRLLDKGQVDKAAEVIRELRDTAIDALSQMRLLVFELRPPALAEEGLVSVLEKRLAAVEARAGLTTAFSSQIEDQLPSRLAEALHGIAKEALNNVLKHAEASHVTVELRQQGDTILLEVSDDGKGMQQESGPETGGLGLKGMLERAEGVGALMSVSSGPGEGTTVRVEAPLELDNERLLMDEVTR